MLFDRFVLTDNTNTHRHTQASVCKAAFERGKMTQWSAEKGEAGNHSSCDSFVAFDLAQNSYHKPAKSYRLVVYV